MEQDFLDGRSFSVAHLHLRFGGKYGTGFVANFLENITVKEFGNWPTFVKVKNECIVARFFLLAMYISIKIEQSDVIHCIAYCQLIVLPIDMCRVKWLWLVCTCQRLILADISCWPLLIA